MDVIEARVLLKNLLSRIKVLDDGSKQLPGVLTDDEVEALRVALGALGSNMPIPGLVQPQLTEEIPHRSAAQFECPVDGTDAGMDAKPKASNADQPQEERLALNLYALELPPPPPNARLCLDFGTAMSKATLVQEHADGSEEIHVLRLGVPTDQEEISEILLVSSVYIDNAGRLWFGKAAIDRSMLEGSDGSRQRLDNIKRRLSEEGWEERVGKLANPTEIPITHADMVLAYLSYMTWAVGRCLEELALPLNTSRRFAMPCLPGQKGRETIHRLRRVVGEAQILADTFGSGFNDGLSLEHFMTALGELRKESRSYSFVAEDITEPLGVAGSIISWRNNVDSLIMVVDIGAGTSDMSLYRMRIDPANGQNLACEIMDSARGLTEAGNYLDRLLIELIIKKSGITSEEPMWVNVRSALELEIRNLKETLFNDGDVYVPLMNGSEVEITLDEFCSLEQVRRFGDNLRAKMIDILESIDSSWVNWIKAHPSRRLAVALTGGGAELPMVKSLADGEIRVDEVSVPVARAQPFPGWLRDIDENLETDYPRIAVSLGGARRRIIERGNSVRVTAGDVVQTPVLGGYYTKGQ